MPHCRGNSLPYRSFPPRKRRRHLPLVVATRFSPPLLPIHTLTRPILHSFPLSRLPDPFFPTHPVRG